MHAEWLALHPQLPSGIPEGLELGSWITKPATEALSVPPSRYMHFDFSMSLEHVCSLIVYMLVKSLEEA